MWGSMPSIAGLPYLLIVLATVVDAVNTSLLSKAVEFCSVHPTFSDCSALTAFTLSPAPTHASKSLTIPTNTGDSVSRVSTVASGESTPRISASATGTVITTSSPAVSPGGSSPAHTTTTSSRQRARTAAITGSIVAVCIVVGILLLVLWRLRRIAQLTLPRQFPPDDIRPAVRPTCGVDAEKNTDREPVSDASHQAELIQAGPENEVLSDPELEDGSNRNREGLTERMRRLEAQVESLLTLGLPEAAPPSYVG